MIRALRAIGIGLAALVVLGCCAVLIGGPRLMPQVAALLGLAPSYSGSTGTVGGVTIGGPFKLTDARTGAAVTEASYHGRWMLVYFGYTFCPDICPTDLQKMIAALPAAGAGADRITPIFITVDPGRDSAAPLARYVGLFSPKLVGLTGSQAQIDAVVSAYRVYVEKVPPASPGAPYLVNHSAFMYLMNPSGKLAAIFPPDVKTADLAHRLADDTSTSPAS
ncbi:SCO family protein [Acidisoma sp.]|uniref:SCO family protein n=1 Tax=Acidisoma sp. TaxID=1872115 RepID=UPI003B00D0D7